MTALLLQILIILLLVIANGLFSLSEIAIVSARKVRLQRRAELGDARAKAALELANEPGKFLSTVQIGITLIGVMTGAVSGATLTSKVETGVRLIPFLAPYSQTISFLLVVLCITYLSLVIGELVPKRLGMSHPESIASMTAVPMRGLSRLASPVVKLLTASTEGVVSLLGIRPTQEPPITEEEINVLIQQGTTAGVFEESEQDIVERVFRIGDRRVSTLMTPRMEITSINVSDTMEDIRQKVLGSRHVLFPVYKGNRDELIGIVNAKDLTARWLTGQDADLEALCRKPLFVPENLEALSLLELFKENAQHIAFVIDEYGNIQGMVTSEDVIDAIIGEIPSHGQTLEQSVIRREDGSWLVDGLTPLDELEEAIELGPALDRVEGEADTLGGLVMNCLRKVPTTGDHFELNGLRFEVVDMDGNRVDKVLVSPTRK